MNGEICEVCGREIKVSIFKNTGVCCELCRKLRAGEITRDKYDKDWQNVSSQEVNIPF